MATCRRPAGNRERAVEALQASLPKKSSPGGTKSPQSYSRQYMRRLPATFLDLMKFVQAIGVGLRAGYDDIACAPVPEYLLALVRELNGDQKPQTPMRRLTSPRKFGVRTDSS